MHRSSIRPLILLTSAVGVAAAVVAFFDGFVAAFLAGALVLAVALYLWRDGSRQGGEPDPGRRRFLTLMGTVGLAVAVGGGGLGRVVRRLRRPNPEPVLRSMAEDVGAEALELVRRTYHPGRSGDLQLILAPGSTANYWQESVKLARNDPRSSHALPWMYLERVPIVVYAPGIVAPLDSTDRVTLADLAPTAAHLMGFDDFRAADGAPLPGIPRPPAPPKVIVTFVIDGGGWNTLQRWDRSDPATTAWPNLKRLMRGGAVYRDAIMGSFPAVTACAHATIGTGAFPRTHGISGHNIRDGRGVRKAYGVAGRARPSDILVPTLADRWTEATKNRAWVGEIGYQVWHLGMLGHGGRPLGDLPVGVYWDADHTRTWRPHNPELYRVPKEIPPLTQLDAYVQSYSGNPANAIDAQFNPNPKSGRSVCCTPPIIQFEGDLIDATFDAEGIGTHEATDLLYVNYKAPDYAGHTWNMLSIRTQIALKAVDTQLGRLADMLESRFAPGEFALIVCADHGQCPTVDTVGGVRLDPIQLQEDLDREFGSIFKVVTSVVPSEVYLNERAMWDAGVTRDDVAAFLRDYRYRDNIGPYVPHDAIEWDRLDQRIFAAVLSTDFIDRLRGEDLPGYGDGQYFANSDPGIPDVTW